MARALGVQNLKIWQVIMGMLSVDLEPSKRMENPYVSHSMAITIPIGFITAAAVYKSSLLGGSHSTRAAVHQVCVDHY